MKVFLLKDVEKVGMKGEMLTVSDGFARNVLLPQKLAVQITPANEAYYKKQITMVEHRKDVVASTTSMLAEKIKSMTLTLKKKMHDDDKLYGSVTSGEIVDLLAEKGISIAKNQVQLDKSIKTKGTYDVIIKLSTRLQPALKLKIVPEAA